MSNSDDNGSRAQAIKDLFRQADTFEREGDFAARDNALRVLAYHIEQMENRNANK
jgi:hypothetical protein